MIFSVYDDEQAESSNVSKITGGVTDGLSITHNIIDSIIKFISCDCFRSLCDHP